MCCPKVNRYIKYHLILVVFDIMIVSKDSELQLQFLTNGLIAEKFPNNSMAYQANYGQYLHVTQVLIVPFGMTGMKMRKVTCFFSMN